MPVKPVSTPSLHKRAWSGGSPPELVARADRVEVLLRQRNDVEGLRQLESLRFKAREGLFSDTEPAGGAVIPAAAVGGAVAGGMALGVLGAVGGLALGLVGPAHLIAVGAKALHERRLEKFLDAKEAGSAPVHSASPRVGTDLTATEMERAFQARHPVTGGMSTEDATRILLDPRSSVDHRENLRADMLRARSAWDHPKLGTTACDTLWDGRTGRLYTGVGHVDKWYLTAFGRDGRVEWAATEEPATSSPALGPNGTVYFRTHQALEVRDADGHRLWTYPSGFSWSDSTPAVAADGTAYLLRTSDAVGVQEPNQRLVAVKDGKELWHFDLEGDYTGNPQILVSADGTLYVTGVTKERPWFGDPKDRASVLAFAPDGTLKARGDVTRWPSYVGSGLSQGPDGTLYACHGDQNLTAFTPDLQEKWTYRVEDRVISHGRARLAQAPVADRQGNVYLSTEISADYPEGYLRKLDPQGKELWSLTVPGGLSTRPHLAADGTIWVGSGKGDLLNVDADGRHLESVPVGPTSWNNFSFGGDGEIFLNTRTRILSFQPDCARLDFGGPASPTAAGRVDRPEIHDQGQTIVIGGVSLPVRS